MTGAHAVAVLLLCLLPVHAAAQVGGVPSSLRILGSTIPPQGTPPVTPPVSSTIPSPYSCGDIGAGQLAGSASYAGGTWTLSGSGSVYSVSDNFQYCSQPVSGNWEIIGRSLTCTSSASRDCAVMVRQSTAVGSANGNCGVSTSGAPYFQWRSTTDGSTGSASISAGPTWLRLRNISGVVSCFASSVGASGPWTQIGSSVSVALTGTMLIGLSVNSEDNAVLATGTFSGVVIQAAVPDVSTCDRYVSLSGNNSNSGTQLAPWRTVQFAVLNITAGQTACVRGGAYDEGITASNSGVSWSQLVKVQGYPGETVWLRPLSPLTAGVIWLDCNCHYIEFDRINVDGTNTSGVDTVIWFSTNNGNNPHHIRFKNAEVIAGAIGSSAAIASGGHTTIGATGANEFINVTVHGGGIPGACGFQCGSYGIYLAGPNNLVDGCDIYDTATGAMQIYNAGADPADNNIVRNCRFHDITRSGYSNQSWGMLISGDNNQFYNNLVYRISFPYNAGSAAVIVFSGSGNKIFNNTFYNNNLDGVVITSNGTNTQTRNNISYSNAGTPYSNSGGGSNTTLTNLNIPSGTTNPLFVNAAADNLHLQAGSPAVDTGTCQAEVQNDLAGVLRPKGTACDIGAFEP